MTKICHIISGDLWAGAEVMAYGLITTLSKNSAISVMAIVLNKGTLYTKLCDAGIQTYLIDESASLFASVLKQIRIIVRDNTITILHAHRYKENLLALCVKLLGARVKLITTQHGLPEQTTALKSRIVHTLNFFILSRFFYSTVAVSNDIYKWFLTKRHFSKKKCALIHNGIALPPVLPTNQQPLQFIIGSAGRFMPVKNYALLIEIARLCKPYTNISFWLAGDGLLKPDLLALVNYYGLSDSFKFLGHKSDLTDFYAQINLFINTSLHEGIPMSILEAMSFGKPVIGSKTGGIVEIISEGENGFLVDTSDTQGFANRCIDLASNPAKTLQLGERARKTIEEHFSIDACAIKYALLYAGR